MDSALSKVMLPEADRGPEGASTRRPRRGGPGQHSIFKLKIEAKADRGILIQNDLFDAELKGSLTIVNTIETPRIVGTAELIHGRMLFKDRSSRSSRRARTSTTRR